MGEGLQPSYSILVVDDDLSVRVMFKSLLEFDGHRVALADSGESALALLEQRSFDLVITDYAMPGMAGDEFAARVAVRWPHQPVIMASGSYAKSAMVTEGTLHVDYFLCKPFLMDELRDAIALVLARRAERAESPDPLRPLPGTFPVQSNFPRKAA